MEEARLYDMLEGDRVRCKLCAHRCLIAEGSRGICQVRENRAGRLYSLVYAQLIAQAIDPIEKKPLFHYFPGSTALSIATVGCNLRCSFCQNADISQMPRDRGEIRGHYTPPDAVVQTAREHGCRSIAYTYTEPTIYYEYSHDVAVMAREGGVGNVYVSNGYMSREMLESVTYAEAPPLIDAANIDLKAFRDAFYREQCGASLRPVLDNLVMMKSRGVWLEVTTLVIPGLNDSDEELGDIARFIAGDLGVETPWHVSRFHPTYRLLDRPATPVSTVHRAREIGLAEGLQFVYVGNVAGDGGEDTVCPQCGEVVIRRRGFSVMARHMQDGCCASCHTPIPGVGL